MTVDGPGRELRSFGRRKGRKATARQQSLLDTVLPHLAVDLDAPPDQLCGQGTGAEKSPAVWLEIGFGGGEHLVWQAAHNRAVTVIGCEPYEDGVIKVLDAIQSQGIDNILLHMGDARDILRWLPEASVSRAFILFPDPWPKRKHQKRRLVNRATLALLARVLKPGAELRFGTDIGDYARSALEALTRDKRFIWLATGPADWRIRPADWPETRYEAKAAREGRRSYYFRFKRV